MTKILEKVIWYSILLQPMYNQWLHSLAQQGPYKTFTVNQKPQFNLYENFKGFVNVTLYNINK